jgi:predicted esterase
VSTRGYSLWGSSAGAKMAANIGSYGTARFGASELPRPSAIIMAYTAYADVSKEHPPTFVVVGQHDPIAPPSVMQRRVEVLARQGTKVAYHEYPGVAHVFGTGAGTSAAGRIGKALQFWTQTIK